MLLRSQVHTSRTELELFIKKAIINIIKYNIYFILLCLSYKKNILEEPGPCLSPSFRLCTQGKRQEKPIFTKYGHVLPASWPLSRLRIQSSLQLNTYLQPKYGFHNLIARIQNLFIYFGVWTYRKQKWSCSSSLLAPLQ
jgi:hypothetical protein